MASAILAPKIGFIDFPILILWITNLFLYFKKNNTPLSKKYYSIILIWGILIFWSILIFFVNGKVNEVLILKPLRQILMLMLVYSILRKSKLKVVEIYKIIIISAIINTIVICIQLYGHNVLGDQQYLMPSSFEEELNVPFRKPGVFSGYPHAGLLSLIAIISLINFVKSIKIKYFVFIFIFLFFSLIVTSRTALLLSIFPFIWLISKSVKSREVFSRFLVLIILGIWGITSILVILPEDTTNVAFEVFKNYSESGSFKTQSQDALNSSYIIPNKISTYLFGNGLFNRTDVDTNIDDGYQVLLYGGGVFYFLTTMFLFFFYFFVTIKNCTSKDNRIVIYLIYIIILIANYKVDCLFSRVISDVLVLFLAESLLNDTKLEIRN